MGIQGLHKALKPITVHKKLSDFSGQRAGIDGHAWLHRAAYGCAQDVVLGNKTDRYVNWIMRKIILLMENNITPIVVFDGGPLPMKREEAEKRRASRQEYLRQGKQLLECGDERGAYEKFTRAISIKHDMVLNVIAALKEQHVEYVVAPYEGDSQLAYMFKKGQIDFCITEDSDLMVFGARHVFCKMCPNGGGDSINLDDINNYSQPSFGKKKVKKDIATCVKGFRSHDDFIHMCVLSGCDYINSLRGIGLAFAAKWVREWKSITRLMGELKRKRKDYTKEYELEFERSVLTFRHQRVYDTDQQKLVHLLPLDERMAKFLEKNLEQTGKDESNMDFLGPDMDPKQARELAVGDLDPFTMQYCGHQSVHTSWCYKEVRKLQKPPRRMRHLEKQELAKPAPGAVIKKGPKPVKSKTTSKMFGMVNSKGKAGMAKRGGISKMFKNAKATAPEKQAPAVDSGVSDLFSRYSGGGASQQPAQMEDDMLEEKQATVHMSPLRSALSPKCKQIVGGGIRDFAELPTAFDIDMECSPIRTRQEDGPKSARKQVKAVMRSTGKKRRKSAGPGWNFGSQKRPRGKGKSCDDEEEQQEAEIQPGGGEGRRSQSARKADPYATGRKRVRRMSLNPFGTGIKSSKMQLELELSGGKDANKNPFASKKKNPFGSQRTPATKQRNAFSTSFALARSPSEPLPPAEEDGVDFGDIIPRTKEDKEKLERNKEERRARLEELEQLEKEQEAKAERIRRMKMELLKEETEYKACQNEAKHRKKMKQAEKTKKAKDKIFTHKLIVRKNHRRKQARLIADMFRKKD